MRSALLCFVGALLMAGCGGESGPPTVTAVGTVTMDGRPVGQAIVVFTPENPGSDSVLAAQAETNDDGQFEMQTHVSGDRYKPGIAPGEYIATVTKMEVVQDMRKRPKHLLPKKYSSPRTSELAIRVKETEENRFDIELK